MIDFRPGLDARSNVTMIRPKPLRRLAYPNRAGSVKVTA